MVCDPAVGATDRICAGFFVLATYMRGRYSDTQAMRKILVEKRPGRRALGGYLEILGRRHPSLLSARPCFFQWSARGLGFLGWTGFRLGLTLAKRGVYRAAVLPGLASASGWTGTPPSWLRSGTGQRKHAPQLLCQVRHGLFHRRVLGYHSQPGDRVMRVYSREPSNRMPQGPGTS